MEKATTQAPRLSLGPLSLGQIAYGGERAPGARSFRYGTSTSAETDIHATPLGDGAEIPRNCGAVTLRRASMLARPAAKSS
jgi:hypothetical protein